MTPRIGLRHAGVIRERAFKCSVFLIASLWLHGCATPNVDEWQAAKVLPMGVENVRWGMTFEEATRLFPGRTVVPLPDGYDSLSYFTRNHRYRDCTLSLNLVFERDELTHVVLSTRPSDTQQFEACRSTAERELKSLFGPVYYVDVVPDSKEHFQWIWEGRAVVVVYQRSEDGFDIDISLGPCVYGPGRSRRQELSPPCLTPVVRD